MTLTKKIILIVAVIAIIASMSLITACGGSKTEAKADSASGETAAAQKAEVAGEKFDTEKFSILVPSGWEKMDISGGVQIYKGNDIMQVVVTGVNVTEADDKAGLESLKEQYSGTELEEVSMLGVKFYKTSFTANGVDQTIYSGVRNGEQVKIQMAGKDHANNEAILAMFESITLK